MRTTVGKREEWAKRKITQHSMGKLCPVADDDIART